MPTIKQMHDLWDSEMFMKKELAKINSKNIGMEFKGEIIGEIVFDPENKDLKIIVKKDQPEK